MRCHDRNIEWKRHKLYIPINQFQNGSSAPNVELTEVTGLNMLGHEFDGSGGIQSVGGVVEGAVIIPPWWNPEWPLGFRVWWTSQATALDVATFKVLALVAAEGEAIIAAATGVLDTLVAEDILTVEFGIQRTSRGIRNANWSSRAVVDAGALLQFSVELDATDATLASSESIWLLGLEVDYTPMMTVYPHNDRDASDGDTLV
jgi:hypothetical protein